MSEQNDRTPEESLRAMIADRLSEYQQHRADTRAYLSMADDPDADCGCEPDDGEECGCEPNDWERTDLLAAANASAMLANAAAQAMQALTLFWDRTK